MGEGAREVDRFVGRADELRELLDACRTAAAGRGSLTVVVGEAGIGKTRLCRELRRQARREGLAVVMARCWGEGAPALWPWQPILDELCGPDTFELLAGTTARGSVREQDRFARFAAVTEEIAAACRRQPTCVVVDDIHAADAGTLLLLRFVVRSLHRLDLALVLTRRPNEPVGRPDEARLTDEIESEARVVALHGFDVDETTELLVAHGLAPAPEVLAMICRVTGGHPLFLRRIATGGSTASAARRPDGLRAVIDQAVQALAPDHQWILRTAAVLGATPTVREAAAVAGTDKVTVLDAVQAAATTGLVFAESPARFAFGHDLVRATLVDGLRQADRLDAHARAAAVIAGDSGTSGPDALIRRAHHALAAAPRSDEDAVAATQACRLAARSLVASYAYEQADRLLTDAVELHEAVLGAPPGPLLVEWAQAALLRGRLNEARARFGRALAAAEQADDPVLLAESVLGLGGYWLTESRDPVERARLLALQHGVLARLPDDEVSLRCRVVARLAADAFYNGGPIQPMDEALDAARRSGDPVALADALSFCHHGLMQPEHTRRRLALADELVRVGAESGHGVLGLMGLCWRTLDLLDLGDARAIRAMEELRQRADALACEAMLYEVAVLDAMLRIRSGHLDEAEAMAQACYELGRDVGELDAGIWYAAQFSVIRWIQGRTPELVQLMDDMAFSPQLHETDFAFRASGGVFAYDAGDSSRARKTLDELATGGLRRLPRSSTWLVGMMAIAELAALLGDRKVAEEAYDLLHPFAELPIVPSLGVVCFGSTHRVLGLTAAALGHPDRAVDHLEQAVAANRRIGNLPLAAMSQAALATTLLQQAGSGIGRDDEALALLADALTQAEAMGMTERAEAWRTQLATHHAAPGGATTNLADPGAPGAAPSRAPRRRQGRIRREGGGWSIAVDDRHVHVGALVGVHYLAELVSHPGQAIPALALAAHGGVDGAPHQEILDEDARQAYVGRIEDLTDELNEAEAHADQGRAERLRVELDTLVHHLSSATGLGGRSRTFGGPDERARTAVRKAIMRVIEAVESTDRTIADVLRSSITTGRTCVYQPHPDAPITWTVELR